MPAERMKTALVNFRQHAPKTGYHSNVLWSSRQNLNTLLKKPTNWSAFVHTLVKITLSTPVETTQMCVFLHMRIHPLYANSPQHLRRYWTKVHKIFTRRRDINGGANAIIFIAILPWVVECQHKQWRRFMPTCRCFTPKIGCYGKVPWPKFTKFLTIWFFSSTVLKQQSALRSVHPLSNERGNSFKNLR